MKQHIEIEQLEELSEEQQIKLCKLTNDTGMFLTYTLKLQGISTSTFPNIKAEVCNKLNIGKMIEILEEACSIFSIMRYDDCNGKQWNIRDTFLKKENRYVETLESELCDALWNAVKNVLKERSDI